MVAVRPLTSLAARLLPVIGAVVVLAACGAPPQPLATAPPEAPSSGLPSASGSAPAVPLPTGGLPAGGFPTVPPATLPGYPPVYPPVYPPLTVPQAPVPRTTTTTPATPRPTPAPKCANGPTKAQVLAVIDGQPGIPPNDDLVVYAGPYCAGNWQFTTVEKAGRDPDNYDPLFVVTTGKPADLVLIEAGADVCSDQVQSDAPKGIRVRACGF
jgi:hypothetical protein